MGDIMMAGIIFDFDDTLIETTKHFDQAKDEFRQIMAELDFPAEECLITLNQLDIKNVHKYGGFMKQCFPLALGETYDYYCQKFQKTISPTTRQEIVNLGWQIFAHEIEHIPGAQEVLDKIHGQYPIFLATKGEPDLQMAKLEASGLKKYFNQVYITPDKTAQEYLNIAHQNNLTIQNSWVIGNSMKGDINPGLKGGFNCIHVYHYHTWDYEEEPSIGQHYSVKSIKEVLEILL